MAAACGQPFRYHSREISRKGCRIKLSRRTKLSPPGADYLAARIPRQDCSAIIVAVAITLASKPPFFTKTAAAGLAQWYTRNSIRLVVPLPFFVKTAARVATLCWYVFYHHRVRTTVRQPLFFGNGHLLLLLSPPTPRGNIAPWSSNVLRQGIGIRTTTSALLPTDAHEHFGVRSLRPLRSH